MARKQLRLIDSPPDTRLDERTKAIGRAGLARARAALADADRRRAEHHPADRSGHPSRPSAA